MSYDVWFEVDAGAGPVSVGPQLNYTYNCSPMFTLACGAAGINDLDGKICREVIESLDRAVAHMRAPENAETYQAMNPPNKWGNHEGATAFLAGIAAAARALPNARVRVG